MSLAPAPPNLRYEENIGWITDLSGKRFNLRGKLFEVHVYFPEVDRYYCPEVRPNTQSLMIEFQLLLSECLWLGTADFEEGEVSWA